ncbi:MAG: Maf-like protein [Bacteroidia bacterium]|nr:Maf-like protein [Bacteroidia bacterium]
MITDNLNKYRIILASRSPRRQQLLKQLGLRFKVVIKDFDESYPENLSGEKIAIYLAGQKARSFRNEISDNEIVITADTIVWCNNQVLGKPADKEEARQMLRDLSGNTHEVITGVSLLSASKEKTFSVSTKVTFDNLSDEEIDYYIERFSPYDKAGAYGIQEWIGLAACSRIEGSYFNVVGLPVQRLYKELQLFIS